MSQTLVLANRQKSRRLDLPLLRRLTRHTLEELCDCAVYELGIHIVGAKEMAHVNETFLQHTGSTDVITFDHREDVGLPALHGELFICVDDAVAQAKEFHTTWQHELARYIVHGILHLQGYDDLKPALRREMKKEENRLMILLEKSFSLQLIERPARLSSR